MVPVIIASYEPYEPDAGRRRTWAGAAVGIVVFGGLGVVSLLTWPNLQGLIYFVVFMGGLALVLNEVLFRSVWRLELTATELRSRARLRTRVVPLSEVTSIRPGRHGVAEIAIGDRSPLRVAARPGLTEFAAQVRAAADHVVVKPSQEWEEPAGQV